MAYSKSSAMKIVRNLPISSSRQPHLLRGFFIFLITILAITGFIGSVVVIKSVYAHDQCNGDAQCGPNQRCEAAHPNKGGRHCNPYGNPYNNPYPNPDPCQANQNRPDGCQCNNDSKCASNNCMSPNNGGICRPKGWCTSNSQCDGKNRPYCSPNNNCVECKQSSHCPGPKVCNPNTFTCQDPPVNPALPISPRLYNAASCPGVGVDVILVIDNSNSMANGKLGRAKAAANTFLNVVASGSNDVRVGLATFDDNGGLVQGLTPISQFQTLRTKINNLNHKGSPGTCLECAIDNNSNNDVYGQFAANTSRNRVVILMSDGFINRYIDKDGYIQGSGSGPDQQKSRDQALTAIGKLGAHVFVSHIGGGHEDYLRGMVNQYLNSYYPGASGIYRANPSMNNIEQDYADFAELITSRTIELKVFEDIDENGLYDPAIDRVITPPGPGPIIVGSEGTEIPIETGDFPPKWPVTINFPNGETKSYLTVQSPGSSPTTSGLIVPTCVQGSNYRISVTSPQPGFYASPPNSNLNRQVIVPPGRTFVNFGFTRRCPSSTDIDVPGSSDPWLAGMPDGATASLSDTAPGQSPALSGSLVQAGSKLTFIQLSGRIRSGPSAPNTSVEGGSLVTHPAENGVAGARIPSGALVGVFLGSTAPNTSPAPASLDFSSLASRDQETVSPQLKQVFLIGDGRTTSSRLQEFVVPQGATRLYLGTMDSNSWNDNSGSFSLTICGPAAGSISGCVFIDSGTIGTKEAGETYPGNPSLNLTPNPADANISYTGNGCYQITNLPPGQYTLRHNIATGDLPTVPAQSTYNLNLSTCSVAPTNGLPAPACANGRVTNANFGVNRASPWLQTMDYNIRNDNGFTNRIPTNTACQGVTIRNGSSGTAGVVFSGPSAPIFNNGKASDANWQISGASTIYSVAGALKTSHASILNTLASNQQETTSLPCSSGITCTIDNTTLQSLPYRFSGSELVLGNVTITDKKILIIADNAVRITGRIQVTPGAFFMIVAHGNITVANTVGAGASLSCAGQAGVVPQIQGNFSTDGSFIISGGASCPTADQQLNIAGSIITNAARGGGTITNNRTLCGNNISYPTFTIQPRLDFALSAPSYMLRQSTNWQEVAP